MLHLLSIPKNKKSSDYIQVYNTLKSLNNFWQILQTNINNINIFDVKLEHCPYKLYRFGLSHPCEPKNLVYCVYMIREDVVYVYAAQIYYIYLHPHKITDKY